ncbi:MAG: insulinase family protein [Acidobacteriota bacterium]|nr:insulinase family protein [Acidobacteriota bacterium]
MKSRVALLLFAGVMSAFAQKTQIDIPYEKFVLPNGLTVIVHEDRKAPIVAVNMWYHVGSKNEVPGKTGFAHLYEHLMFGGSENFKGSYIKALEKVGATNLNGTTNSDRTNYFEDVPTPALDYALWIESDRLGHFLGSFDQKTLDLQRGVVQNEKRQGENQPYGVVEELLTKNTYPVGHPYSWTTIGSMEDLNAASLEDVKTWFRTYYGPSNVVLCLAGDIDVKTAKDKITRYFGDIPPGPPVAHQEQWVAKMTGTHRGKVQDRVPQARIYKVWNVPGFGTADADYLNLVSDVLARGRVSRFYKRLVYDDQIATDAFAFMQPSEIGGQFLIQATAKPGVELSKVEKAIDEELARFLAEGPTASELKRVQTQYTANLLRGIERIGGFGGKSDILAESQTFTGDPSYVFKTGLQRHESATPENLKAAANKWLSDGVYVLEVEPFPALKSLGKVERSTPPPIGPAPELKLPKLQRATLSNGLKVILAERHELPLVNFRLEEDAGFASDQFASPGTASLATSLLTGGTSRRNALQISEEQANLGAQIGAISNLDLTSVRLSALKSNLDASLDLFADIILNPSFPEADFKRQQSQQLAGIQREKASPVMMGLRVLPPLVFGADHAYGIPFTGTGTQANVSKLTRQDLAKFHATWFKPNNGTLIIVGDTTLSEITPKLEKLFASWKPGAVPVKKIPNVAGQKKSSVYLIDQPGAQQSTILVGQVAPAKSAPNSLAIEAMNDIFAGNFGARLNMNLREDKHYTYGASAFLQSARAQRPYITVAPVQTDKTKESIAELNREFHDIVSARPVTSAELATAQDNQTLSLPGSNESMNQLGTSITDLVHFGLPDDYYDTYIGKVKALKTSDLDDAAKSVLKPDALIWVVVGDRAKIEQGIRELNLGEVQIIDADGKPTRDR